MEIPRGNTWKIAENRTLKWGSSPPSRNLKGNKNPNRISSQITIAVRFKNGIKKLY
jgi:hypothetical protein